MQQPAKVSPTRLESRTIQFDDIISEVNGLLESGRDVYLAMPPTSIARLVTGATPREDHVRVALADVPDRPVASGDSILVYFLRP